MLSSQRMKTRLAPLGFSTLVSPRTFMISKEVLSMRIRGIAIVAALIILFGSFSMASGQRTGSGGTVTEKPKQKTAEPTRTRNDAPVRKETRYIVKTVTPTTGQLFVATEPGAAIRLEPIDRRNKDIREVQVPIDRRDWVFNDLKPGEYRVAATKAEYHETVTTVNIKRNETEHRTVDLKPILYSLTINTNVDTGELKYAKDGQTFNVVTLKSKTILLQLPAGSYVVEITAPEGLGYKAQRRTISVEEDKAIELSLERIRFSTEPLLPTWTNTELQGWEVPPGWHAESKHLIVKGAGVALPLDENRRYYKDFLLSSSAKMVNGIGVGFALRARDAQNYYLLQLTGENSDEPYYVRLFVVKNGVAQRIQANQIVGAPANAIKTGNFFAVTIRMVDNRIKVDIEDSKTGLSYPLGILIDPNRSFTAGAVGIAARSKEENVIWIFNVCTDCMKDLPVF